MAARLGLANALAWCVVRAWCEGLRGLLMLSLGACYCGCYVVLLLAVAGSCRLLLVLRLSCCYFMRLGVVLALIK